MRQPLLLISLSLAVLLLASVLGQDKVPVEFQTNPVLVQTGTSIVITLLNLPSTLSITWYYNGTALGLWAGGSATVAPPTQFQGRVTITSNKLQIGSAQLRDAGIYQADVVPSASTGLSPNSGSVQLRVFDAVAGVSLFVPSIALEGGNVSLRCTWTAGTEITVQWGKGGSTITADSRITISGGSLVINPASRSDAGQYSCTASNLVSAQTVTQSLTIYYGPDTPVLTKDTPKNCVGGGDVLVGQTVRLTCTAVSLPPALFSWQRNGQPITSNPPNSGVLSLQTFSTNDSGQYTCTARNSISGNTSAQSTALAVVDVCFSGGEVAGIVIGSFLGFLIIVFLIVIIFCLVRRRRALRQRETVIVQKTNTNQRPVPPDPQPNGIRDLDQGPNPPLYQHNPVHVYRGPRQSRDNLQTPPLNGLHNSDTRQHNGRTHANGLLQNTIQNTNSFPHNGIDNPAFVHADAQNANTLPVIQQQNPSILIQTGTAQSGGQPQAVHVSLNTLPQTTQPNNNAQLPAIHVNLNPYPTSGQQTQQDSSFPLSNVANNNASQSQNSLMHTGQSNSRMQSGVSHPSDPQLNGQVNAYRQDQSGLIPTGYTHYNSNNTSQRNANTQTYQQELEPHRRSDRNSGRQEATPSSSRRQLSWDLLRGTPAYPNGTREREQTTSEYTSDSTAYTSHPPIREGRTASRSQTRSQRRTASHSRTPPRQDASLADRRTRHHSADFQQVFSSILTQHEPLHRTQRSPHTQRESAQRDITGSPHSQTAPRQEATHRNNPQALPLTASVGHSAVSQGSTRQQGLTAPQGTDARALADPNHLQQAHMVQQNRTAPIQRVPEGVGTQTAPVTHGAGQPPQGGTAPAPYPSAQPKPSNLTQAALKVHTARAQTFQNRREQTKAALLHPGTQPQAPAAGPGHPPTPPPVIPLTQFQTLPKKRTHHKSPMRGPQPPRPPVNMPVAQRPDVHHHPTTMPTNHHHHPQTGHVSAHRHGQTHVRGHGQPARSAHQWQQQAHRGRPR